MKHVKNIILFTVLTVFNASPLWAITTLRDCNRLLALRLPVIAQTTDFTCGVACFDSLLRYWKGFSPGELPLAYGLGTTVTGGTPAKNIVLAANYNGLYAREQFGATIGDLRQYVSRGETIYVGWISGGAGHYSLVQGIDTSRITLMDPWYAREHPGQYNQISFGEFIPSWNDGVRMLGQVIRISPNPLF